MCLGSEMGQTIFHFIFKAKGTVPHARRIALGTFIGALAYLLGAAATSAVAQDGASHVKNCGGQIACLEQLFRGTDQKLNAAYRDLLRSLDTDQKSALRDVQRAWINRRNAACSFQSRQSDFGLWVRELVQEATRTECMIRWIEARTAELTAARDQRVGQPRAPAVADPSRCADETTATQSEAANVSWSIVAPSELKVGETLRVSWRAAKRFPTSAAVYLVIAVPGEARFDVGAVARQQADPGAPPALPGFLALPGSTRAPLDIQFGRGKTCALCRSISRVASFPGHSESAPSSRDLSPSSQPLSYARHAVSSC